MITVTDTAGTSGTITVEPYTVADAIRGWYPDAPADVTTAIDDLQTAINRDDPAQYDHAQYLGITLTAPTLLTATADAEDMRDVGHEVPDPQGYLPTEALIRIVNADGDEVDVLTYAPADDEDLADTHIRATLTDGGYTLIGDLTATTTGVVATVTAVRG